MKRTNNPTFVSLKPLYAFLRDRSADYEEALNLKSDLGAEYSRECEKLTRVIEEVQGINVWGAFDARKYWKSLYLGKAGLGRNKNKLLRARITEELKDERCCLWRRSLTEYQLFKAGPRVHRGGREQWDRYIKKAWKRSVKKAGATHIIWARAVNVDNANIKMIEAELIEALNPVANIVKPVPPDHMIESATNIYLQLRRTIHHIRGLRDSNGPFHFALPPKGRRVWTP